MKKQSLLKPTIIFLVILGFLSIVLGCVENKTIIPAEKDLPADLSPQVKAALLAGVYTLEDYNLAQSLIAEGKTEERLITPFKFLVEKDRFSNLFMEEKELKKGVKVFTTVDKKNIANIWMFDTGKEHSLEDSKADIIYRYMEGNTRNFDQFVVLELKGKFLPNLPYQEVTIYKLKCFMNGHVRYISVIYSEANGRKCFASISNYKFAYPEMGDVIALFLNTLKQISPSS